MRIYIETNKTNETYFKNVNETHLKNLNETKTINYQNIYSLEGLFRIQNNNIMKLIPKDIPIEKINYNNNTFLIDKSKFELIKNIYSIPFNHTLHNIKQIEYKFNNKSKISLIVEYNQNLKKMDKINNIYFSTNETNFDKILKDNIIEYLSLINDIKQS